MEVIHFVLAAMCKSLGYKLNYLQYSSLGDAIVYLSAIHIQQALNLLHRLLPPFTRKCLLKGKCLLIHQAPPQIDPPPQREACQ